jgi:hypothetical protein
MGKCAWCGAYIPDSGNKKMAKSLMGSIGLDLVVDAAGALTKQYCSEKCKRAAAGSGEGSNSDASEAAAAMKDAAEAAAKREGLAAVQAVSFDGDAKSIMTSLGNLQVLAVAQNEDKDSAKAIRKAAFQKFELGIRALKNAGDTANTEYFEKQLKSMKLKAFLTSPTVIGGLVFVALVIVLAIWLPIASYTHTKGEVARLNALHTEITGYIQSEDWATAATRLKQLKYDKGSWSAKPLIEQEWEQKRLELQKQIDAAAKKNEP